MVLDGPTQRAMRSLPGQPRARCRINCSPCFSLSWWKVPPCHTPRDEDGFWAGNGSCEGPQTPPALSETNKGPLPNNRGRFTDLPSLATYLTRLGSWPGQPGTPVVDKTGLTSQFDLVIDMNKLMANISEGTPATNEAIYAATVAHIEDTIGLKLEPRKLQVDVLVTLAVQRSWQLSNMPTNRAGDFRGRRFSGSIHVRKAKLPRTSVLSRKLWLVPDTL